MVVMTHHSLDLPPDSTLCMEEGCKAPLADAVGVNHRGRRLLFGVCAEHAHDIDWGIYDPRAHETLRGYIGRAIDDADIAG
ncbi:hypothetical protein [Subtercola boreus]|uniref:hypothetical protein n=1 Tax=Subtercola boreus TaxID=120213 RepID=UPI0015588488|nr:hypothetical protein [Subtercola boreus]